MFRSSKPVVFDPYGRRRKGPRVPTWLLLLVTGAALGVGGVIYVQQNHLPPRLSAEASAKLRQSFADAERERARLAAEAGAAKQRLAAALSDKDRLAGELAASRRDTARLSADVASLIDALPPDPRGGAIGVRAARFAMERGALAYDVVLSRDGAGGKPWAGVMQFVVAGASGRGSAATVNSEPVALSIDEHASLRGSVPLPEGFDPRQTTIQVLDRPGGKLLGMRVMLVK